jgi:hypothetical protein
MRTNAIHIFTSDDDEEYEDMGLDIMIWLRAK